MIKTKKDLYYYLSEDYKQNAISPKRYYLNLLLGMGGVEVSSC